MSPEDALLPLWGLLALSLVMLAAWTRHRRTRNAGVVDLLWAAGLGSLAIGYALLASGWLPRRILVASMAGAWSLRLTLHLAARLRREPEDGRYGTLREKLASRHDRWMLGFFQAQAVLAVVLSLAFLVPISAEDVGFGLRDLAGVLIWVLALGGEALADRQLRTWRVEPRNEGRTCRAGLWRYSRHPNYFFEWMHWLSYPVLSMGLSLGWAVWFAPALMLLLVLKVTGIPPTEEQALRKRGADYRSYQETTNAFFPGPSRARSKDAPQPS